MEIKRSFALLIVLFVVILLTACTRNLTPSQEKTPTMLAQEEMPIEGTEVWAQLYLFQTQTAIAQLGGTEEPQTESDVLDATPSAEVESQTVDQEAVSTETVETEEGSTEATAPEESEVPESDESQQSATETEVPEATKVVLPTATPGIPTSYTLEGGEFPYCIARRFDVDIGELLRLNNIGSGSIYYAGMVLQIPQSGTPFQGARSLRDHPTTYTVRSGDTIYKIACLFGDVNPDSIALANGLSSPNDLSPGQVIEIP